MMADQFDGNKRRLATWPTQGFLTPAERIEQAILLIRGQKMMLDADLAVLYGVTTKRLNEQVKRNMSVFRRISCFS